MVVENDFDASIENKDKSGNCITEKQNLIPDLDQSALDGYIFETPDGTKKVLHKRRSLLEVEDLNVQFGNHQILRDINFQIRRGETVAIIGESGCGKTVFLKTLIGLVWPTSGRVWFQGRCLAQMSSKELTQTRTKYGFVFQLAALFDSMTIGDNVSFPLRQSKVRMTRKQINERVAYLLEEVGLSPSVMNLKPAELSGGMRKRVGFARALIMSPELMLYDEPTTGLDPIMSDVINELIIRAHDKHHVTGIIVTHDMKSAMKVADRIVMFYPTSRLDSTEPQMIYNGLPNEIENSPDSRVVQFVRGEAGERFMEMTQNRESHSQSN